VALTGTSDHGNIIHLDRFTGEEHLCQRASGESGALTGPSDLGNIIHLDRFTGEEHLCQRVILEILFT